MKRSCFVLLLPLCSPSFSFIGCPPADPFLFPRRDEFQALDRSNIGYITKKDFTAALGTSEGYLYDSICRGTGITYHEYIAAVLHGRVRVSEARLSLVFGYLDPEGRGVLSAVGLASALGDEVSGRQIEEMIESADSDRDQLVTKR